MQLDFVRDRGHVRQERSGIHLSPRFGRIILMLAVIALLCMLLVWLLLQSRQNRTFFVFHQDPDTAVRTHVELVVIEPATQRVQILELPDHLEVETATTGRYPLAALLKALSYEPGKVEAARFLSLQFGIAIRDSVVEGARADRSDPPSYQAIAALPYPLHDKIALFLLLHLPTTRTERRTIEEKFLEKSSLFDAPTVKMRPIDAHAQVVPLVSAPQDRTSVALVNASSQWQLLPKVQRYLENANVFVVTTSKDDRREEGEMIVQNDAIAKRVFVQDLAWILGLPLRVDSGYSEKNRADIVIVLGVREEKLPIP